MSADLQKQATYEQSFRGLLHRQRKEHPPSGGLTGQPVAGQIVIVTGSNSGVGYEAAKQLLMLGASKLIMAVRSMPKGEAAALRLRRELQQEAAFSSFSSFVVKVWELDMQSYSSIRAFASRCHAELSRIDIVLLNAGMRALTFERHPETKHEMGLQVNFLGTALLAALLVPVLRSKKTAAAANTPVPRLCAVGSDTIYMAKINVAKTPLFQQLDDESAFSAFEWYPKTKLLLMMFIKELASHVNPNEVIVSCTNPGMTSGTSFNTDTGNPVINGIAGVVKRLLSRDPATGASACVDAVVVQGAKGHGSFLSDWTIKSYPSIMYTAEGNRMSEQLWKDTIQELGLSM